MPKRTSAKRPIVDVDTTTVPTSVPDIEADIEAIDISSTSDQPTPPGSPVFESQREYLEYQLAKLRDRDADADETLDNAANGKDAGADVARAKTAVGDKDSDDIDILEAVKMDKFNVNVNIKMGAGYSGAPVINFNIYTIAPRGKKREGDVNEGSERKMRKVVDKDLM